MKVSISVEIKAEELVGIQDKENVTTEEVKEYLTDTLFEVCEDWALNRRVPDLEWSD
jgi:hypothetical protein